MNKKINIMAFGNFKNSNFFTTPLNKKYNKSDIHNGIKIVLSSFKIKTKITEAIKPKKNFI